MVDIATYRSPLVVLDVYGNTTGVAAWEDLRFPAQAINPAGSANAASVDATTYFGTLLFPKNQDAHVAGVAQLPHSWQRGTAIRPHIHWAKTTSASGTVAWQLRYAVADIGGTFGAYSEWVAGTLAISDADTAHLHALTTFGNIALTEVGESGMVLWELRRDVSEDTYNNTARLLELDFHYLTNKGGTKDEVPA